jgi:hypothetical protein
MGFAAKDPHGGEPTAAAPVSLNVQACASLDTLADESVDPVASRVFARSPFAYGHEADPPADETATPLMVLHPELTAAVL